MPLELSEMSLEEALRSYSSVKGHRTRVEREIGNLLRLLSATYSSPSETRLNEFLEKLQKHTHRLSDIAEYLVPLNTLRHVTTSRRWKISKKSSTNVRMRYLRCSTIATRLETPSQLRPFLLLLLDLCLLNHLLLS